MAKARDIDTLPHQSQRDNRRKPSDVVELLKLKPKQFNRLRPLQGVYSYAGHWVKTIKKDGTKGNFYIPCSAWDAEEAVRKGGNGAHHCAFCNYEAAAHAAGIESKDRMSRFSVDHYMNVIVRALQKNMPDDWAPTKDEEASGFKSLESSTPTPIRPFRMTDSLATKVKEQKELNVHEIEGDAQSFPVSHPRYGCDVLVKMDPDAASPSGVYSVQKGDAAPIRKSERQYLSWDLSDLCDYLSTEEVQQEFDRWALKNEVEVPGQKKKSSKKSSAPDDDDDDVPVKRPRRADPDDDDDDAPPPKKPAKKPARPDPDDDDEDDAPPPPKKKRAPPPDDDDEDEDPPPKKKPAAKKASKPAFDDSDEDDDDDAPPAKKKRAPPPDDDDDEDDAPPAKKPAKKPARPDPDDDDDDDDDAPPAKKPAKRAPPPDDDDDDDAPPPPKKKRAPPPDDDDEDEAPPVKKPAKKPAAKRAAPDDDDDDDVPVAKSKKRAPPPDDDDEDDAPPPKKRRAPPPDDDDDDL